MPSLSRRDMLLLLAALGGTTLAGCARRHGPLRIGANLWSGYAALRVVEESGQVPALRVLDLPSSAAVLAAFRNGLLDGAALTLDESLQLVAAGLPVRIVLIFDISMGADSIVARPGFDSIYQLAGARIGVETEALGAYMVARALDLSGLRADGVHIVNLPFEQQDSAFRSGKVDAVVCFEPMRSRLIAAGGRELFSSRQIPGEVVDVLVMRRRQSEDEERVLAETVSAYFHALQQVRAAPEQVAALLGARLSLDGSGLRAVLQRMDLPDVARNRALLSSGAGGLRPTLLRLIQLMQQRALLPVGTLPVEHLLDRSFVERVAQ